MCDLCEWVCWAFVVYTCVGVYLCLSVCLCVRTACLSLCVCRVLMCAYVYVYR